MPREGKTSITVSDDVYEMLERNKPDGVTWDYHFQQLQYATDKEAFVGVGDKRFVSVEVLDDEIEGWRDKVEFGEQ